MQQRQPRLGDILDDYCPRERRLTNHAVVAMVGDEIKQTRCTTCDAEHEFKHAKVPRPRSKSELAAGALTHPAAPPRRVVANASTNDTGDAHEEPEESPSTEEPPLPLDASDESGEAPDATAHDESRAGAEEGPVHRRLIRATLPRSEGQPPPERPAPDFTIRQPGGRPGRFRGRHRGGPFAQSRTTNGNFGSPRGAGRQGPGRPPSPSPSRSGGRHGSGRKRSK
jgi:hypothetical protein